MSTWWGEMAYLLDTNVVSELRRRNPDRHVVSWHADHKTSLIYLSTLVAGEMRVGIERLRVKDVERAAHLDRWLAGLLSRYEHRFLPVTVEVAEEWGRMNAPVGIPIIDGLMAATARVHRLTLVTRNVRDVADTGVPVVNPFTPMPTGRDDRPGG